MNHLHPDFLTAAYILIAVAAVCFGVAAARLHFPTPSAMIARGQCPQCKARKSLRTTPISEHSVMVTCGVCAGQWLVESPDEKMVIYGPASEPLMPPLRMTYHPLHTSLIFETEVGIAIFDLMGLDSSHRRTVLECKTPRHKLRFLYQSGIAPTKLDLKPNQKTKSVVAECTPYQWFAASAGLDIYHLMPGWANDLHGTEELRYD